MISGKPPSYENCRGTEFRQSFLKKAVPRLMILCSDNGYPIRALYIVTAQMEAVFFSAPDGDPAAVIVIAGLPDQAIVHMDIRACRS